MTGALVLQGTRGREHVTLAEVRLTSPPINLTFGQVFSVDCTEWNDFLVVLEDRVLLPFSMSIPWGLELPSHLDLAGKVIIDRPVQSAVGVEIHIAPPPLFVRVAEACAYATDLAVGRWSRTPDGDGAAVQLHRRATTRSAWKAVELQLRLEEERLVAFMRVHRSRAGLAGIWPPHTLTRNSTFRFEIPCETEDVLERFFREEFFRQLEQRPSGSLPLPAQTARSGDDQLPRIVDEPLADQ